MGGRRRFEAQVGSFYGDQGIVINIFARVQSTGGVPVTRWNIDVRWLPIALLLLPATRCRTRLDVNLRRRVHGQSAVRSQEASQTTNHPNTLLLSFSPFVVVVPSL